jgi:hypothetical protein
MDLQLGMMGKAEAAESKLAMAGTSDKVNP